MPSKEELRDKLIEKLEELFQLDKPELDFGFYRIMHAKAEEVREYLEEDLPLTLEKALGEVSDEKIEEYKQAHAEALENAKEYGVENPEEAPPVKEAWEAYQAIMDSAEAEAEVYDHLYRFFSRYYEKGDFVSQRYRVRETDSRAAPYAIPYNGEEVKLHWANHDQYYIKTGEYFSNFSFDLREAYEELADDDQPELEWADAAADGGGGDDALMVHFRVVEAEEGEHDNVKNNDRKVRKFRPYDENPVELNDDGELVVNFESFFQKKKGEYIYDDEMDQRLTERYGSHSTVGKKAREPLAAAQMVFDVLEELDDLDPAYPELLQYVPPPKNKSTPPLMAKYYEKFIAKNTMDYFIHKDLGGFLRRELDFYIKNEVMRLDDVDSADAPRVESYLDKIKAIRSVAHDIIDFLDQLENFQKKLWLKKKFVVETNYCITLDRVPEELYSEIAVNEAQREEWVKLFAIDEIEADSGTQGYSEPLTVDFLEENQDLLVDTRFFDQTFKDQLLDAIEPVNEQCDGVLVNSESFQALNLLKQRRRKGVECIYIDPPYNTGTDGFIYKDAYQHSSWLTMLSDRIRPVPSLLDGSGTFFVSCDDHEEHRLRSMLDATTFNMDFMANLVWKSRQNVDSRSNDNISNDHEFVLAYGSSLRGAEKDLEKYSNPDGDSRGPWMSDNMVGLATRARRPNLHFEIVVDEVDEVETDDNLVVLDLNGREYHVELERVVDSIPQDGELAFVCRGLERGAALSGGTVPEPVDGGLVHRTVYSCPDKGWRHDPVSMAEKIVENRVLWPSSPDGRPRKKKFQEELRSQFTGFSTHVGFTRDGTSELDDLFRKEINLSFPKPTSLMGTLVQQSSEDTNCVLDYFAGSGTTGDAVIQLNREDDGNREYILVEMAEYFDTVLKPRIQKVVYSEDWEDGKPASRDSGISHCFKYIRLESYEDTLNNLQLANREKAAAAKSNQDLRKEYLLNYMLEVETAGSPSLLNIDEFTDPTSYKLKVKKPGSMARKETNVDLVETFNYLIGLRLRHIAAPETFEAEFHRPEDPELPEEQHTKLQIDGRLEPDEEGDWWFRTVTGWIPSDPMNPEDSGRENVLIVWRKLTDDREKDNAMLDAYFEKKRINTRDFEFDVIYVNGSNNLPNLRREDETWKVRSLEEEFMERMWDVDDV
jgi:adenine-specific DNA-methyltransferase